MNTANDGFGHRLCTRCNKPFECSGNSVATCQCNLVKLDPSTLAFLAKTKWGCLCLDCLVEFDGKVISLQGKACPKAEELQEGLHYYKERGLWVFTEYYHMLRGYCCESGCRHCAYGFRKEGKETS